MTKKKPGDTPDADDSAEPEVASTTEGEDAPSDRSDGDDEAETAASKEDPPDQTKDKDEPLPFHVTAADDLAASAAKASAQQSVAKAGLPAGALGLQPRPKADPLAGMAGPSPDAEDASTADASDDEHELVGFGSEDETEDTGPVEISQTVQSVQIARAVKAAQAAKVAKAAKIAEAAEAAKVAKAVEIADTAEVAEAITATEATDTTAAADAMDAADGVVSASDEASAPGSPGAEEPVQEPISIATFYTREGSQEDDASDDTDAGSGRRSPPRQVSVFRRGAPPPVSKEQHYECATQLHEDEDIPSRSPLSSLPFFMWGGLTLFLALVMAIFLTDLAKPLLGVMDSRLHSNLLIFINANFRSTGMLLASVITLCAIAIPLTANNYTSKLINLFTNSKVNRGMFGLLILTNLVNMVALLFFDTTGPWPLIEVAAVGMLSFVCFVMVIPYAFYILHFLQPDEIIRHIEREVMDDLMAVKAAGDGPAVEIYRKRIIQNLKNLSNIALRSVDRHDRDTAMLSLEALRHIIHHYFSFKHEMPSQWFRVSRMYFLSLSGEMRRRVEQGKTFLEAEVMEEFALVLGSTFGRLRDMVRMIARTVRHIGVEADEADMPAVLELTSLYFNTFLRAAISRKEPEAVYMIVYHYRRMAEEMMPTNDYRPVRVAFYLSYYGHQSVRSGMVYVANLVSSDLSHMVALAYEIDAPSKAEIFELFLEFGNDDNICGLPGVLKSRFKLAVFLHHLGFEEEFERLLAALSRRSKSELMLSIQDVGEIKTPMFWEVTDRHRHNDYLAPALFRSFAHVKGRLFPKENQTSSG